MEDLLLRRRNLLITSTSSHTSGIELYDYIQQDGNTYFATDIKLARDVTVMGACRTFGASLILWGTDVLTPAGNDFFNHANIKYDSGSTQQQLQCNAPINNSSIAYAYYTINWTNIAVACQGMTSSIRKLMRFKNINSDADAIMDIEPSALSYASKGSSYSFSIEGPANLYVMGSPGLDGSVNTKGHANSGTPTSKGARLYYIKVYEADGIKSHHLRAAIKDGVIGLYDTMTKRFYEPNAGSPIVGNI